MTSTAQIEQVSKWLAEKEGELYEFKQARRPPESSGTETRIAQIFADGVH